MEGEILERAESCVVCVMRHTVGLCPAMQAMAARIGELEQRLADIERREQMRQEWRRSAERLQAENEWRAAKWSRLP